MERWSREKAAAWHRAHNWQMGANYVPSNAVNDVEMWRRDTFSPDLIRKELQWAADAGMNTLRVFLSYHVWKQEGEVFLAHFEEFLTIAHSCGHTVMPILFDDCAFDYGADPVYGPQPDPDPNRHNGRWVPSPGFAAADDPGERPSLKAYVDAVIGRYREDPRILAWDLYNEPGNTGRQAESLPLLIEAFRWARALSPVQPLSSCIYTYEEDWLGMNTVIARLSDIINLHSYVSPEVTKAYIEAAEKASGRPVIVSEWLHRPFGNTIQSLLPWFHEKKIFVWQWGLVNGRTQTWLNWDTSKNADNDTSPWQHDILRADGTPYDPEEIRLLRLHSERG